MLKKMIFSNQVIFWFIIGLISVIMTIIYSQLMMTQKTEVENTFTQHSFSKSFDQEQQKGIIDFPDINTKLEKNNFLIDKILKKENLLLIFFIVYSVLLSILFSYREKTRITTEYLNEKIQIEKERVRAKTQIYDSIIKDLYKYKTLLSPEINLESLDQKLLSEVSYILFSTRVVLEKVLLSIAAKMNLEEATLSNLIYALYQRNILDKQQNSYAHTIKAYGNQVAHPQINETINFDTKDALLVLSTLLSLLDSLHHKQLIGD